TCGGDITQYTKSENIKRFFFSHNTKLKDHTIHFPCLSLIYSVFIHVITDSHFPKDKTVFQLS
ncbi:hypothetical protein LDENG_00141640, partial [Lucifuga dentata]